MVVAGAVSTLSFPFFQRAGGVERHRHDPRRVFDAASQPQWCRQTRPVVEFHDDSRLGVAVSSDGVDVALVFVCPMGFVG